MTEQTEMSDMTVQGVFLRIIPVWFVSVSLASNKIRAWFRKRPWSSFTGRFTISIRSSSYPPRQGRS